MDGTPGDVETPPRYEVEVLRDIRIPTQHDGVSLSADVHLPTTDAKSPAILTVWPYRKDIGMAEAAFTWFAQRGYASILVDARGTGSSDGAPRAPFSAAEVDDAVAVIEWAARQGWCDGNVGMWGHSYGAIMALRAGVEAPAPLKAIVPYQGILDPELDLWHPSGARGGVTMLSWGTMTLSQRLIPSVRAPHDRRERERWRDRLHGCDPWLLDLFQHAPGDPGWRSRTVDASAITVPTLCVAGWRDLMCDATVRAFEEIPAPKKLVVGPWTHTIPQDSPDEPVDFFALALRWWDRWLRGEENGVMDEPAAAIFVQGERPGWRAFESWPPSKQELVLAGRGSGQLVDPEDGCPTQGPVGAIPEDATAGTLSGTWWLGHPGIPLDQHDDDLRGLCLTSNPLPEDVLIAGRPEIAVTLQGAAPDATSGRSLTVRLSDVSPEGRSTFITAAVVGSPDTDQPCRLKMWPTAYRIPAGNRLRLVVTYADFPRLWPTATGPTQRVGQLEFVAPTLPDDAGADVQMPRVVAMPELPVLPSVVRADRKFEITRDPFLGNVAVAMGEEVAAYTPRREALIELSQHVQAEVDRTSPEAARMQADNATVVLMATGETVRVEVNARMTMSGLWIRGQVSIDDLPVFDRRWEA